MKRTKNDALANVINSHPSLNTPYLYLYFQPNSNLPDFIRLYSPIEKQHTQQANTAVMEEINTV